MSLLGTHPGQSLIRCRCLPERDETLDLSHFLLPRAVLNEALSWGLAAANANGSERICQHYGNLSGLGPLVWVADPSWMVSTPRLDWMFNTEYKSYIIRLLVSRGPASCLSTYHCILSTQNKALHMVRAQQKCIGQLALGQVSIASQMLKHWLQ